MNDSQKSTSKPRRGVYLLPNLFTVGALFAGFYAIVAATKQHFEIAAIAIFVAMLLDSLDGRIARLTRTQTEFGAQMDSLSDMVCFGITPALVMYLWSLSSLGKAGWLAAFIYTVCSMLRLARFNSMDESKDKRYFQGLSTTAAAGFIAAIIWAGASHALHGPKYAIPMLIIALLVAGFKVSPIRYRSFKDLNLRGRVPFFTILLIVLVFVLVTFDPPDVFLAVFGAYAFSGPVMYLWGLMKNNRVASKKDDD